MRNVVNLLSAESEKILRNPDMRERIIALGMEPASSTPEELKVFLKEQLAKWKQVIELAGLKAD
jgi:tripartite-type tricarboxylate transporter receptor subunit TctC